MTGYAEGYRVWGWGDAADVPVPADLVAAPRSPSGTR